MPAQRAIRIKNISKESRNLLSLWKKREYSSMVTNLLVPEFLFRLFNWCLSVSVLPCAFEGCNMFGGDGREKICNSSNIS